jgi:hypothetical protein
MRRALVLAVLALATAPAGVAHAQGNPIAPLPQAAPDTTTVVQTPSNNTSSTDDSGLGTAGDILLYGTGLLLLLGIAWLVVRDARRRAPIEETVSQPRGTHSPQRHAHARAKAKAAKQQRKRNRSRR